MYNYVHINICTNVIVKLYIFPALLPYDFYFMYFII
jgi:hypothetical protein